MIQDKILNFLRSIFLFIKKSYPKSILVILFILLLAGIYNTNQITKNEISNLEKTITVEKESIDKSNKEAEVYLKEFRSLNCDNDFISSFYFKPTEYRKDYGEERFSKCTKLGNEIHNLTNYNFVSRNINELEQELKEKQQKLSSIFWEKFFSSWIFIVLVSVILLLPVLRILVWVIVGMRKQIMNMNVFQKYVVALIFCILVILILLSISFI